MSWEITTYEEPLIEELSSSITNELGIEEILVGTKVQNTAARRTYEKGGMRPTAFRTGTMYL